MSTRIISEVGEGRKVQYQPVAADEAKATRAFDIARRHSGHVRFLRIAVMTSVVGGVIALIVMGLYRTFDEALGGLSLGQLSIDGTTITVGRPRLTGARPDGGEYVVNASKAIQDLRDPTKVNLVEIEGEIVLPDHDTLHLTAALGQYDSGREQLDLSGVVRLKNSHYTADIRSAHIDFKTGAYSTREPVTVVTTSGASIRADSGSARDNGKEITFNGRVKTVFHSDGTAPAEQALLKGMQ